MNQWNPVHRRESDEEIKAVAKEIVAGLKLWIVKAKKFEERMTWCGKESN